MGEKNNANRKALSLYPFVVSFKNMSLNFDVTYFFFKFFQCKSLNEKMILL